MKKLRLKLDELQVESFETDAVRAARGTVEGNEEYTYVTCPTAPECRTPGYASCAMTRCQEDCSSEPVCSGTCGGTGVPTACCA